MSELRRMSCFRRATSVFLAWVFCSATAICAQSSGGPSLSGTVVDPSGAVIAGAAVRVNNEAISQATHTDPRGVYALRVAPGNYHLQVDSPGFARFETSQLHISAGRDRVVNVSLTIAAVQQDVDVSNDTGLSTEASANKSALIFKGDQLDTFSNDPAVMQAQLQALAGSDPGTPPQLYIDGFSSGTMPPKQNIREVHINESPFTAARSEFGRGRIDISTKPGSNRLHGGLDYNYGNSTLNARNPYTGPQPPYSNDYANANVNGPVGKNASFFLSYERIDLSQNATVNAVTVDPATLNLLTVSQPVPNEAVSNTFSTRVDRQIGPADTLIVRYTFSSNVQPDAGTGLLVLPSEGYSNLVRSQSLQLRETHVFGPKVVVDSGLQYISTRQQQDPVSTASTLIVQGSFSGGGNPVQALHDNQDRVELEQDYTLSTGKHLVRTGWRYRLLREANLATAGTNGEFVFPDLVTYRNTLLDLQSGLSATQIRAKGDGASQFSVTRGMPSVSLITGDFGVYAEDEWKARPELTFTYGLRFESQSAIPDHLDFGPRVGFAYALKLNRDAKEPALMFRGGFGIFYKRFAGSDLLTSLRENGVREQVIFCANPDFFPSVAPDAACLGTATAPTTYQVGPSLRTPVQMQGMFGVEHSFGRFGSVAASWYPRRQFHELDSLNLNAPLPGTGARPYGGTQNVYVFASNGISKGQDLNLNANVNLRKWMILWVSSSIDHDETDTAGADSFPSNSYHPGADMGAYDDFSSRKLYSGINARPGWGTSLNLFFAARSHSFFNITTGQDNNQDSIYNDRPAFATDLSRSSVVRTPLGAFDTDPLPSQTIVPINYGHAPSFVYLSAYMNKDIYFGRRPLSAALGKASGSGASVPPAPRPYQLELGIGADNLLNSTNPGLPVGVLTSPFFGKSISLNAPFTGNTAANRAVTLRAAITF